MTLDASARFQEVMLSQSRAVPCAGLSLCCNFGCKLILFHHDHEKMVQLMDPARRPRRIERTLKTLQELHAEQSGRILNDHPEEPDTQRLTDSAAKCYSTRHSLLSSSGVETLASPPTCRRGSLRGDE